VSGLGDLCAMGHLVIGSNAVFYEVPTLGGAKRVARCAKCDNVQRTRKGKEELKNVPGSVCTNGHPMIDGSYLVRKSANGKNRYDCKECQRDRKARLKARRAKEAKPKVKQKLEPKISEAEERRERKLAHEAKQGSGNFKSLNYLKLNKRGRLTSTALEMAMDRKRARCDGKEHLWVDYDEEDKSSWPSTSLAEAMCMGCPLLRECGRHASAIKPYIGVWAGQVWYQGKVYKEEEVNG
jgi:DNA-directed RNA polymerase subunit M/transcription elongation factor TFIIS